VNNKEGVLYLNEKLGQADRCPRVHLKEPLQPNRRKPRSIFDPRRNPFER
jgi:hypothetical protein